MTKTTDSKWLYPKNPSNIEMAFPANVGEYLPSEKEIPKEEFRDYHNNKWCKQASTWFFSGVDLEKSTVEFADHITGTHQHNTFRHLQVCLGSYEPQHEHKIRGVGYLMSLWFKDLKIVAKKDLRLG